MLGSVQSSVQSMVLATVQSSELGSILKCIFGSVVGRILGMRAIKCIVKYQGQIFACVS